MKESRNHTGRVAAPLDKLALEHDVFAVAASTTKTTTTLIRVATDPEWRDGDDDDKEANSVQAFHQLCIGSGALGTGSIWKCGPAPSLEMAASDCSLATSQTDLQFLFPDFKFVHSHVELDRNVARSCEHCELSSGGPVSSDATGEICLPNVALVTNLADVCIIEWSLSMVWAQQLQFSGCAHLIENEPIASCSRARHSLAPWTFPRSERGRESCYSCASLMSIAGQTHQDESRSSHPHHRSMWDSVRLVASGRRSSDQRADIKETRSGPISRSLQKKGVTLRGKVLRRVCSRSSHMKLMIPPADH